MHRIDNSTATTDGRFTEGDPQTGVPATIVSAAILNAIQDELVNAIEKNGVTLDKGNNAQLAQVIEGLKIAAASTEAAGKVELATVDEAKAGENATLAVTPPGLAAAIAAALKFIEYGSNAETGTLYLRVGTNFLQVGKGELPNSGGHSSSVAVTFDREMTAVFYANATALKAGVASGGFSPVMTVEDLSGTGMTVKCDINEDSSSYNINTEIPFVYIAVGTVAA